MNVKGNPETRKRLLAALSRARRVSENNGCRLTVSAIAREAGVSHTLIFRDYPDIVAKIKRFAGVDEEGIQKKNESKQKALEKRLNELCADVATLRETNCALVRRNDDLEQSVDTLSRRMRENGISNDVAVKEGPKFTERMKGLPGSGEELTGNKAESILKVLERRLAELRAEESILREANRAVVSRNATLELVISKMKRHIDNIDAGAIPLRPFTLAGGGMPTVLPFRRR